jgi:CBS domain containing-hemolysin-like protein
MEAFYLILSALLIFGFNTAYFSAVLSSIKFDDLKEPDSDNTDISENIDNSINKKNSELQELKLNYDDTSNAFSAIEMCAYSIYATLSSVLLFSIYNDWFIFLYYLPITFILIILLRTVSYSLGVRTAQTVGIKLVGFLKFYRFINYPFYMLIKFIKMKIQGDKSDEISLEELSAIVDNVCEEGSLGFGELKILKNVMKFREVYVSDIMTPRTVIFNLSADSLVSEVVNSPEIQMYSRFPIRDGESLDDGVVGYVMSKDVFKAALDAKGDLKLRELAREVNFVPENGELDVALDLFLKRKQHLFMVVDEYGGIEGLLTMEDVIETILGSEIVDEADRVVDLREFAKQRRDKRIAIALAQNEY